MLPSYLQWPCHTYLALGRDKGTKLRIRLTRNGISWYPSGLFRSPCKAFSERDFHCFLNVGG
jgi:hypothetical protein